MTARVAAIILAAGLGRRFAANGATTDVMVKAVAPVGGTPMVRAVALSALASRATPVLVVTGRAHAAIEAALGGLDVTLIRNADYATGMASSLKAGIASLANDIDGALVLLADMPFVKPVTLDALIARLFARDVDAVVPVYEGTRGNPVLIGRSLFDRLQTLTGDDGARRLLSAPDTRIDRCFVDDAGITIDIDTRAELDGLIQNPSTRP